MRKPLLFIVTGIALIFIIIVSSPIATYSVSPIVQQCSNGVTSPTTAALLNCTFPNPITHGNVLVALITCYGCSIAANPVNNDSLGNGFAYVQDNNCCGATGAAQISTIMATNVTNAGTDKVSAQIRDTAGVNRTTWLMSVYEVSGVINNSIKSWKTGFGFSGTASTVSLNSALSWTFVNSLIFEGADSDNGLQPIPTATFTSSATNAANQHAYSFNYSNSNSPSSFVMGTFGGSTSMSESVVIIPYTPALVTTTLLTTLTVTAWNTIDPGTPINWITLALFLTLIPGLMWGMLKGFNARPSATVFTTLIACFIGSIMGVISGLDLGVNAIVPLGITVFNGITLGLYVILSRQRGNPVT